MRACLVLPCTCQNADCFICRRGPPETSVQRPPPSPPPQDFKRAEPELDVVQALRLDPSMVFRFSLRHGRPNLHAALSRRTAAMLAAAPAESG